jgi:hypothetical protein
MSPLQFKKRTSQLAIPDEIYEKYDKVCKQCKICSSAVKAPPRSHVSGMRSENFGDLVFVDHCFIPVDNGQLCIFHMLDGASHLLWAQAQSTSNEAETVQSMRDWIDELHCKL